MTRMSLAGIALAALFSCAPTEETLQEVKNGSHKIAVRTQQFHHSAVRNVDICVADAAAIEFPTDKGQCFLHGFDFSGLAVKWLSEASVEISFACGRITTFSNFATISKGHSPPVQFHASLLDRCDSMPVD